MPRYKDADALVENIKRVYCADCNSYGGVRCRACGTGDAIEMIEDAPDADVAPRSELERWRDMYYRANAERMESKNDYDSLMRAVESERRMAGMNILKAIHQEIINARIVNQRALTERRNEPGVDPKRDAHCFYCNGRIDALSCFLAFVEDLEKICLEEQT